MRTNHPVTQREYPFPPGAAIVSRTDLRGHITYCNETFVEVSGFSREELIGQPQNILRHPDMPCEAFRDLWETIRTGQPWSAVVKNRRKNGDHYWVRANVTPTLSGGEPAGYLSVRTCPTREEVAAAERLYRAMREVETAGGSLRIGLHRGMLVRRDHLARFGRGLVGSAATRIGAVVASVALLPMLPSLFHADLRHYVALTCASGLAAMVLGTLLLRRQVIGPMNQFARQTNTMASGDLGQPSTMGGDGASAGLACALNQLKVNLRAVVGDVRKEIVAVSGSADQIATGAADLASRTEMQAASLEQAAAAMEEFTSVLQQSRQRGVEAQGLAAAVAAAAGEGQSAIDAVRTTMQAIEAASRNIGEVTTLVDELAFQTNLLALNAAVEAARAGEHGRGFAVVAGEVRALAQRSTTAARDIRNLIGTSLTQVEQGVAAVGGADERVRTIVDTVARVRLLIDEIAAASDEQATGVNQLNSMIGQLDGVTQRNTALVAEATGAARALRAQAGLLEQSVAVFQLGERAHGAAASPVPAASRRVAPVTTGEGRPVFAD
ncbi:MAG: PAS domain-containing protein [Xanthomonadaceae bacterium]|nr:PAS domain-containing protein [Xanthomonadaceae bacterium]